MSQPPVEDQAALWNGPSGHTWVESQDLLDLVLRPFEDRLVEPITPATGRVLDVGCGTGSTTLTIARRLAGKGSVTGVDISEPMLARAKERAEELAKADLVPPTFIRADAQTYGFTPGTFDAVLSRFGVMFFEDPVRAFANLRSATKKGGALRFIAWRTAAENAFMTTAERAVASLLPPLPPRRADGPGQFAFGERRKVEGVLSGSGWSDVDVAPIDVPCAMPSSELMRYVTRLGPVGRVLSQLDEPTRERIEVALRSAFEPFVDGSEVRFVGACWVVQARA